MCEYFQMWVSFCVTPVVSCVLIITCIRQVAWDASKVKSRQKAVIFSRFMSPWIDNQKYQQPALAASVTARLDSCVFQINVTALSSTLTPVSDLCTAGPCSPGATNWDVKIHHPDTQRVTNQLACVSVLWVWMGRSGPEHAESTGLQTHEET